MLPSYSCLGANQLLLALATIYVIHDRRDGLYVRTYVLGDGVQTRNSLASKPNKLEEEEEKKMACLELLTQKMFALPCLKMLLLWYKLYVRSMYTYYSTWQLNF